MPPLTATKSDGTPAAQCPPLNKEGSATAFPTHAPTHDQSHPLVAESPTPATKPSTLADATSAPTDETLMHALRSGEDAALAPLMQRWELPVKGFLLRLGVPSADVEDVAQEAFVRLYLKRAAYRSGAPFKPWLLTLAANLGRNRMRWRIRRREHSIDIAFASMETSADASPGAASAPADTNAPEPWQVVEQKQRRAAVRAIVAALPPKLRDAVMCVDLEELSHAEAAQVLGCTTKAIENRVRRARERIRHTFRS